MEKELLRVEGLTVKFRTYNGEVTAVNNLAKAAAGKV